MTVQDHLRQLLETNKNTFLSGEEIARRLGVSRNAVWKAIKALQADGYPIQAVPNRGYCLAASSDVLSASGIRQYLTGEAQSALPARLRQRGFHQPRPAAACQSGRAGRHGGDRRRADGRARAKGAQLLFPRGHGHLRLPPAQTQRSHRTTQPSSQLPPPSRSATRSRLSPANPPRSSGSTMCSCAAEKSAASSPRGRLTWKAGSLSTQSSALASMFIPPQAAFRRRSNKSRAAC